MNLLLVSVPPLKIFKYFLFIILLSKNRSTYILLPQLSFRQIVGCVSIL